MPVTVWSPLRRRPIQPGPATSRPGATRRSSGSAGAAPSPMKRAAPPVPASSGRSFSGSARRSAISIGFAAAEAAKAVRRPSAACQTPGWVAGRLSVARPPPASSGRARVMVPSGAVTVISGGGPSARLRRVTARRPASIRAVRSSSSSSVSRISQCAMRRRSSCCGPPPSCPRDHSQIWSDSSSATRPSPTRSSTSSGAPSGPSITVLPLRWSARSQRYQRPHCASAWSVFAPTSPSVTGCRKPRAETRGRNAPSATMFCRPVGRAGSTCPSGVSARLTGPLYSGPVDISSAPPPRT